ncbi:MAG: hypothetical protein GEV08_08180 [Acidimicrobiia bacterium]|nr:hypothetical protein [Acidimicrobiia bacterium]
MAAIPSGMITFLFTDIEGSTRSWVAHPEDMRVAVARHDAILRSAIEAYGGYVFSRAGDAFSAAFARAADAVPAAVAIQGRLRDEHWPEPVTIRVRMGLHTGTADERDADYFGPTPIRAARLSGAAHGGQIVLSAVTARLVGDLVGLRDLGRHHLAGFGRPEAVYQVVAPGLDERFPPLRASGMPGNLPRDQSPFVGRAREIDELRGLLAESNLVTFTGVGGVGKSRLALAAVERLAATFDDGAWFLELAPLLPGGDVARAVAEMFGIQEQAGRDLLTSIAQALDGQRLLLVLDSCEHVVDAAAGLAMALGKGAPSVRLLATSREALGVPGERVVAISPLGRSDAQQLFRARAIEVRPDVALDAAVVDELCARLDRLPLAIELAAARVRSMTPADVLARLGDRFRLLRGGRRLTGRHQTLRTTVTWSYDLLSPEERVLFDRLAVFAGGFALRDVEAVCGFAPVDPLDVADIIMALVEKSMVVVDGEGYRLLETLREFAAERLAGGDELDAVCRRHLEHYVAATEVAALGVGGRQEGEWSDRIEAMLPNVRAAFAHACELVEVDGALRIVRGLTEWASWRARHEAVAWAHEAVALPGASQHPLFAAAHVALATGAYLRADYGEAERCTELALQLEPEGTLDPLVYVVRCLWAASRDSPDVLLSSALALVERAERVGNERYKAQGLVWVARGELRVEDASGTVPEHVLELLDRAVALADRAGNASVRAWNRINRAQLTAAIDPDRAAEDLRDAIRIGEVGRATTSVNLARAVLARLLAQQGSPLDALEVLRVSITHFRQAGTVSYLWNSVVSASAALAALGEGETAARLFGAVLAHEAELWPNADFERGRIEIESGLRKWLGDRFDRLAAEGAQLSPAEAADLARQEADAALARECSP